MWKLRSVDCLFSVLFLCFSASFVAVGAQGIGSRRVNSKWQTLNGSAPLVIARGGFSGIFPDSSLDAYKVAVQFGLLNLHVWCDVQLTKDGFGICFPDIMLQNASNIMQVYPNKENTYNVNGDNLKGWFSVDFTLKDLATTYLTQRIYSRPPYFDDNQMQILPVEMVVKLVNPPGLWLNIQHDMFFSQHNLSMISFIVSLSKRVIIDYISSPEVRFLKSMASRFRTAPAKLIFKFLGPIDIEPSTNQTYGSFLNNLTSIRTFASGILVPKYYIWPVDDSLYLRNHTNLVLDAHKAGLEVYASDFVNDATLPYDYSYDPVAECLSYIDNGQFSVDGVLSDFPLTPSAAIDCYAHMGKNETVQAKVLIISSEGASGDFPGCTDKAYYKASSDGADILDCPVQMTNDGIPFCLGSINLRDRTNAAESEFRSFATTNSDLNITDGIFAYNLTWSQIQGLTPAIFNPYTNSSLFRNPRSRNEGKLMQLLEFLSFSNNVSSISGVMITIENAAYLAEKQGLSVIDAVLDALIKAGYNNQTAKKVMIASSDSAVLLKFKSSSNYELVYQVDENVRDILNSTILEIKEFASSVIISKKSVFPTNAAFLEGETNVVPKLQAFDLSVYVRLFRNEFVSQPWDFFSDAYFETNQYVSYMGVNGVISDFPATAAKYRRNRCLGYNEPPAYMTAVQPGGLLSLMQKLPPAEAPYPLLTESDVIEPPLPPVAARPLDRNISDSTTAPGPSAPNGHPPIATSTALGSSLILLAACVLLS